jgi:hypothetical protein
MLMSSCSPADATRSACAARAPCILCGGVTVVGVFLAVFDVCVLTWFQLGVIPDLARILVSSGLMVLTVGLVALAGKLCMPINPTVSHGWAIFWAVAGLGGSLFSPAMRAQARAHAVDAADRVEANVRSWSEEEAPAGAAEPSGAAGAPMAALLADALPTAAPARLAAAARALEARGWSGGLLAEAVHAGAEAMRLAEQLAGGAGGPPEGESLSMPEALRLVLHCRSRLR